MERTESVTSSSLSSSSSSLLPSRMDSMMRAKASSEGTSIASSSASYASTCLNTENMHQSGRGSLHFTCRLLDKTYDLEVFKSFLQHVRLCGWHLCGSLYKDHETVADDYITDEMRRHPLNALPVEYATERLIIPGKAVTAPCRGLDGQGLLHCLQSQPRLQQQSG